MVAADAKGMAAETQRKLATGLASSSGEVCCNWVSVTEMGDDGREAE